MLPPQNVFLWHGEYFRLIVFKKQKTQAGLFELAPLTAERNLKDCPGWALSAEISTKNRGQGLKTKVPCVSHCLWAAGKYLFCHLHVICFTPLCSPTSAPSSFRMAHKPHCLAI